MQLDHQVGERSRNTNIFFFTVQACLPCGNTQGYVQIGTAVIVNDHARPLRRQFGVVGVYLPGLLKREIKDGACVGRLEDIINGLESEVEVGTW